MPKKKPKKRSHAKPQQVSVTLSQCLIVKNEERNIEKALSWGRGIVSEQIVVDTGSTDRTIEIAERIGAKVLHFEWVNDFAAAKNFAIEQATGNWIAFLDADEYIESEEALLVVPLLEQIMSDPKMQREYLAVNCPWVQLGDDGVQKEVLFQERLFRNLPKVRYVGRIHEKLSLQPKNVVQTKDFRIMHTGYTGDSFINTGKASRNVELLREELRDNPKSLSTKAYLAESLRAEAIVEKHKSDDPAVAALADEKLREVDKLFKEVADSRTAIEPMHKKAAYEHFMRKYQFALHPDPELEKMSLKAHREYPDDPKFMCYYAMALNKKSDFRGAFVVLKNCEAALSEDTGSSPELTSTVTEIYATQMILAAQGLGDTKNVLKCAEILLLMNKANLGVLQPYIATLTKYYGSIDEIFGVLAHIYDMSSKSDLLLIARAAKNCGAINIAKRIIEVAAYLGKDN